MEKYRMTPKEIAVELTDKFYGLPTGNQNRCVDMLTAKESALITIDEIFDELHRISVSQDINLSGTLGKWGQVKSEILKLYPL